MPSLDHSAGAPGLTNLPSTAERPLVSLEGWARFEARARNRRIERRLEAARAAIKAGRFDEARAALAELHEIDAALPILPELAAEIALAEQPKAKPLVGLGPYAAAAATFAALMLAASWLDNEGLRPLHSFPIAQMTAAAPMVETSLPTEPVAVSSDGLLLDSLAPTAGEIAGAIDAAPSGGLVPAPSPDAVVVPRTADAIGPRAPETVIPRAAEAVVPRVAEAVVPRAPEPAAPRPVEAIAPPAAVPRGLQPPPGAIVEREPEPPLRPVETLPSPPAAASTAASAVAAAAAPPRPSAEPPRIVDETSRVRDVLKRYQAAYDRLDARLAHDVWPAVNQAALARAFGDLESQSITFNNCDVRLRADTAAAKCTGSARYTPKVGSREARVEPRVWNFTLRKQADAWLIETARAER